MKSAKKEFYTCPICNHNNKVKACHEITTQTDPKIKKALLDGSLLKVKCKKCKHTYNINYPILYDNSDKRFIIHFNLDSRETNTSSKLLPSLITSALFELTADAYNDYNCRIVKSQEELYEKILIFENGLDDRIIEILKYICYNKFNTDHSYIEIKSIYFNIYQNNPVLLITTDNSQTPIKINMDEYYSIYDCIKSTDLYNNYPKDNNYVIDMDWAIKITKYMNELYW